MAETSISKVNTRGCIGKSFKERLTVLGCPYTDGVDETWIAELLFQQGEARIRLIQWLYSRYNPKLAQLLADQHYGSEARLDSRLQKLLSISSMLGLCRADDIDLIKGSTSSTKQIAFWNQLLDIVTNQDMSEDPHRKTEDQPGIVSDSMDLGQQFSHDCFLPSSLAHQRDLHEAFISSQVLLPPDLMKLVKQRAAEMEQTSGHRASPPSLAELDEHLQQMNHSLQKARQHLEEIKSKYTYQEDPRTSLGTICQTLKLVLSELSQLMTTFMYTMETEMRPWCNKHPPRLTPLGPVSKRLHKLLHQFKELLDNLKSIRGSFQQLSSFSHKSRGDHVTWDTLSTIASLSDSAIQSYSNRTTILEESSQTDHTESMLESFLATTEFTHETDDT